MPDIDHPNSKPDWAADFEDAERELEKERQAKAAQYARDDEKSAFNVLPFSVPVSQQLITPKQAAILAGGFHTGSLKRLQSRGFPEPIRYGANKSAYVLGEVLAFIEAMKSQRQRSTPTIAPTAES